MWTGPRAFPEALEEVHYLGPPASGGHVRSLAVASSSSEPRSRAASLCFSIVTSPSRHGLDRFSSSMTLGHLDHLGSPPRVSHGPPFDHICKALFPCQTCHGLGCGPPSPHLVDALGFCLSFFL